MDKVSERIVASELKQGHALLAAGKVVESAELAHVLVGQHPNNPHAWHLLCGVHSRAGRLAEAVECAEQAVALAPNDPTFLLQYGQCLVATGRRADALAMADRVATLGLERADWNDALGTLLTYCEEPVRALVFFTRAVELAPNNGNYLYDLAMAQRMAGHLVCADATLNRVIALQPGDARAYHILSGLRVQTPDANHIDEMTRLLQRGVRTFLDEITLCFALAKELEDLGRYEASFNYLRRGCNLQRRHINYNVADDIAIMDRLIQLHVRTAVDVGGGFPTDECIFVLGLPRSGTTLVERILASHSAVSAAGELQAFPREAVKAVRMQAGGPVGQLDSVQRALDVDPEALGRAYIDATRPQTGKTPRFVDKLPINYLYAGLIRRALPRARIVALARDPMDSCYAMYKTLFVGAYPFSYNLAELGEYYAAWHRLMLHWRAVLADSLLIVQYEDLVAHQEDVSRRILAHCGLEWQDSCLAFQLQEGAVTSASAAQVRRGMYSSSVGKWRHLERELQPLAVVLDRHAPASGWRLANM
jgi:tetratricopeptide (TPR) repeat protein